MGLRVPSRFVLSHLILTWREVELGLQNGWLSDEAAVDLAIDRVNKGDESADVLELASVLQNEKYAVAGIVHRLASREPECSEEKWLFLLLAWLYDHQDVVDDPLTRVEELYARFDYPDEIASFVRYMPAQDPTRVGELYLFEAWRRYLDAAELRYSRAAGRAD